MCTSNVYQDGHTQVKREAGALAAVGDANVARDTLASLAYYDIIKFCDHEYGQCHGVPYSAVKKTTRGGGGDFWNVKSESQGCGLCAAGSRPKSGPECVGSAQRIVFFGTYGAELVKIQSPRGTFHF